MSAITRKDGVLLIDGVPASQIGRALRPGVGLKQKQFTPPALSVYRRRSPTDASEAFKNFLSLARSYGIAGAMKMSSETLDFETLRTFAREARLELGETPSRDGK